MPAFANPTEAAAWMAQVAGLETMEEPVSDLADPPRPFVPLHIRCDLEPVRCRWYNRQDVAGVLFALSAFVAAVVAVRSGAWTW